MKYRAEIDGLRALAVVPVILFHAGFELFSGGFVGVDVFFVISGYLITTILIEDIENKRFSIVNFYERRARRILPALFFVMLVCIPFAWMWMLPNQMKDFSQSLVAVSLFASNILFWRESGYFAAAAEEKPLLHTWSLAVEEQYYVLFPIFLILAWRFGKNRVFWMIVVMAAISLLLSEWGWRNKATANFYLAPTRAWELFAGSIAAFIVQKQGVKKNDFLALVGLAAIIFSIFFYDETVPFPSVYTLVPVLGVVMLVLYADKATFAAKLLSTKAFVGIGLISYSAYLWHQPLFAFAKIRLLEHPSSLLMVALSSLSMLLAYFSWRYIEKPFRSKHKFNRAKIFVSSAVLLASFTMVGFVGHFHNGFLNRFPIEMTAILNAVNSENPLRAVCRINTMREITHVNQSCWYGETDDAETKILYWGDSHTDTAAFELAKTLQNVAIYHAAYASCPPILGLRRIDANSECNEFNQIIYSLMEQVDFDYVVLSARWRMYLTAERFDNGQGYTEEYRVEYDTIEEIEDYDRQSSVELVIRDFLQNTFSEFPEKKFIVVGQIPEAGWRVPDYISKRVLLEGTIPQVVISREHIEQANAPAVSLLTSIEASNYVYFEPLDVFCDEISCRQNDYDNLIYKDDDHLTVYGAKLLATAIATELFVDE